jgi:hypothetical protein
MEIRARYFILPDVRVLVRLSILCEIPQESSMGEVLSAVWLKSAVDAAISIGRPVCDSGWRIDCRRDSIFIVCVLVKAFESCG